MTFLKKIVCILFSVVIVLPIFSNTVSAKETSVTEIDILIKPDAFRSLIEENNRKVKFPAIVGIGGDDYFVTDINTRGNTSFFEGQYSDAKRLPFELSVKNHFKDIDKLKLNCHTSLYGLLSELTAYRIYELMGIPTPFVSPVFLKFNSVDFGLYLGVEDINEHFIEKTFGKEALETGTLYKCVTEESPWEKEDCINTDFFGSLYCKFGKNHDTLLSLLDALNNQKNYEQYINMDSLIRFFACIAATGDYDSLLTHCNNFYMFAYDGKITFIPWDPSLSFYGFRSEEGIIGTSPFFSLIFANENHLQTYYSYIDSICDTFLSPFISTPWAEEIVRVLEPFVKRDRSSTLDNEIMLRNITSGNILIDGNFSLALSENYRQLKQQLSGECSAFYIPDSAISDIRTAYGTEIISTQNQSSVLTEICDNYSSRLYYERLMNPTNYILAVVLIIPFIVLIIYLVFSTVKQIKNQKKTSKRR